MAVAVKRQITSDVTSVPSISGVTGSKTIADTPTNTDSLALGSDASPTTAILTTDIDSNPSPTDTSTSASSSATGALAASSKSSSIPIGVVVGICVGTFVALACVLLVVLYVGQRSRKKQKRAFANSKGGSGGRSPINERQNAERRKSGREVWMRMDDKDGDEAYEKFAMRRTSMSAGASMPMKDVESSDPQPTVTRSVTVRSAKSTKTFKSIGYGHGLGLTETFRTPEGPPQLEFTDADIGNGRGFSRTEILPPFARRNNDLNSWDGDTIGGDSFLSLKRESGNISLISGAMSPGTVVSHQTPPATEIESHRWEEAEVVSPSDSRLANGSTFNLGQRHPYATTTRRSEETVRQAPFTLSQPPGVRKSKNPFLDQNPFADTARVPLHSTASVKTMDSLSSAYSTQPPWTAHTHASTSAPDSQIAYHHREESNEEREERAMKSLIAALNISPDEAQERLHAAHQPTPRTSAMSADMSDASFVSATSGADSDAMLEEDAFERHFPLPPTDIEHHHGHSS